MEIGVVGSLRAEELKVIKLIGLESGIEGDQGEVGGLRPGGEEGVHPEFGRGDAGGDVFTPSRRQADGFDGEKGGSLVEHDFIPDEPGGGGLEGVVAHDLAIGEEAEDGLLDGAAPAAGGRLPLAPPNCGGGMMLVAFDENRQPDVGINEREHRPSVLLYPYPQVLDPPESRK